MNARRVKVPPNYRKLMDEFMGALADLTPEDMRNLERAEKRLRRASRKPRSTR